MMDLETKLSVVTGSGVLLRQDDVVLFIPAPDERAEALIAAIRHLPKDVDATFDRLADLVVEREFSVPDFACIGLADRVKIRAFGDIEVTTDLASAPMLSGAGSATWVEHGAAMPAGGSVTISVSVDGSLASDAVAGVIATDLVEGLVPAGGFELTASEASQPEHSHAGSQDVRVAAALDALGPVPEPEPVAGVGKQDSEVVPEDSEELSGDPEDPVVEPAMQSSLASDVFDDDLVDAADAKAAKPAVNLGAANTIMPPADLLEKPPPPDPESAVGDLPPPPPAAANPPPPPPPTGSQPVAAVAGESVMARPCPSGHSNRPSRVTCSVCDAFLPSGQDALELMSRPPVGHLVFTDGTRHVLDKNLIIGRAPVADDGVDCDLKVIRSDQISRRHLEISVKGWDVFVEDSGSRNGTVLIPTDGAAPVKVEAGMPQLIEPGAAIHFADQTITLAAVGNSPVALNGNEVAGG